MEIAANHYMPDAPKNAAAVVWLAAQKLSGRQWEKS